MMSMGRSLMSMNALFIRLQDYAKRFHAIFTKLVGLWITVMENILGIDPAQNCRMAAILDI